MKRVIVCFAVLLLLLCGCKKEEMTTVPAAPAAPQTVQETAPEEPDGAEDEEAVFDYAAYDWDALLQRELFDESELGAEIAAAAELEVTAVTATELTVAVRAPDVYADITAWYGAVSDADFSVEALDAKLQELLGGEAKEQTFVLPYELTGDMPFISYPHDFLNAVSCGILDFYYDLYAEMDSELGGGEDG